MVKYILTLCLWEFIDFELKYEDFKILHDNHGAHKSKYIRKWIGENLGDPEDILVSHPARSMDLNPCEHLGSMLKRLVRCQRPTITDEEQLWEALLTAHGMLVNNRDFFFNLIHSMPARMQEVIRRDGNVTRY
jgi:hypothetical protein